jgi:dolichol kinase
LRGRPTERMSITKEVLMRKAVHSVGAFILVILALFGLSKAQLVILSMTMLYLASEYLRLSGRSLPFFSWLTRLATSEDEQRGVVMAPIWFALGSLSTITLFPFKYALIGVLTLSIGDPVASLVGLSVKNRHPYPFNESKSIEGTLAGLLVAVLTCAFFTDPITSIIGCTTGMIVEASPIPINDNVTIPIISSLASYAFCILLGS